MQKKMEAKLFVVANVTRASFYMQCSMWQNVIGCVYDVTFNSWTYLLGHMGQLLHSNILNTVKCQLLYIC